MVKAVLDTNVIVSSYLSSTGPPASIRTLLAGQRFELIVSTRLLDEYRRALAYPRLADRHGMSVDEIAEQVEGMRRVAVLVPLTETLDVITDDPADNMVLETALAGNARYIVSGDVHLHHLGEFRHIQIVSPAMFLALLEP